MVLYNSMDILEIVVALEEKFKIEINDDDIETFTMVDELVHYIIERVK